MRTFLDCINGHVENKTLSKKQAAKLTAEYDQMIATHKANGNSDETAATVSYMRIKADRIAKSRRANAMHFQKIDEIASEINEAFGRWDKAFKELPQWKQTALTPWKPNKEKLYRDLLIKADFRGDTLMLEYVQVLEQVVTKHSLKKRVYGNAERLETFNETIRVMLNGGKGAKGDVAEMMQALVKVNDLMVRDFRAAGGIMGKMDNYAPQTHSRRRILKPDQDRGEALREWKAYITPRLAREKMVDHQTGLPLDEDRLQVVLDDIFDSIVDLGETKKTKLGGGDVFSRRSRMRQLQFNDGDGFIEYNNKFGSGKQGLYDAYMGNVAVMARDTGAMQLLGPKAKDAHTTMMGQVKAAKNSGTQMMFDTLVGPSTLRDQEPGWLRYLEGSKNIIRASLLDGSGITALNDITFVKLTADVNGMGGMGGLRAMGRFTRNLTGATTESSLALNGGHHIAASVMAQTMGAARALDGDAMTTGWTVAVNNWTQRMSGMHHVTNSTANAMSQTFSFEMGGYIKAQTSFNKMDHRFRDRLAKAGINEAAWNKVILKSEPQKLNAEDGWFLLPENIAKMDIDGIEFRGGAQELARKISDLDMALRYEATNAPDLRLRAASTLGRTADSKLRGLSSSVLMFKSFPLQVMLNHFLPTIQRTFQHGALEGGLINAIGTVGTVGVLMGVMTIQTKEVAKGRTPRKLDDVSLLRDAVVISGFGGLFADILLRDTDGRPAQVDLLGPLVGGVFGSYDLLTSVADSFSEDSDYPAMRKILGDSVHFGRTYMPAGGLPYAAWFTERMLLDGLEKLAEPDLFEDRNDRLQSRILDPREQEQWWKPASLGPIGESL